MGLGRALGTFSSVGDGGEPGGRAGPAARTPLTGDGGSESATTRREDGGETVDRGPPIEADKEQLLRLVAEQLVPTAAVTIAGAGGGEAVFGFVAASALLTCSPSSLKTAGYLAKSFRTPMPSLSESWPQRIFMEKVTTFALPLNSFSNS